MWRENAICLETELLVHDHLHPLFNIPISNFLPLLQSQFLICFDYTFIGKQVQLLDWISTISADPGNKIH